MPTDYKKISKRRLSMYILHQVYPANDFLFYNHVTAGSRKITSSKVQ